MRIDRYGEGRVREGWRGRIRGSEAEASLLGDYGSLIPIQRSSTTREKKKPPQAISRRRERERKRKTRLNAFHSSARYVCTLYRVGCLFKIRDTKAQSRYTGARGVQSLRYREREEGGWRGLDERRTLLSGWKRLAAAFVTAKSSETSRTMLMILSDSSSPLPLPFTCGFKALLFALCSLLSSILPLPPLGFHNLSAISCFSLPCYESLETILVRRVERIHAELTRLGRGKKNCPPTLSPWWWSFEIGRNLWKRRHGSEKRDIASGTEWSNYLLIGASPVSCAITLANSPAGNFNGYNWNRKTGRLPLVHATLPPLRIRNYPILRSASSYKGGRGGKSLALNYFQFDLVTTGIKERERVETRKFFPFLSRLISGKFLLSGRKRRNGKKDGEIIGDIGIRSETVEGTVSTRRVSPVITRVAP